MSADDPTSHSSRTDPDVVVLRGKPHGMAPERYADALRDRLPHVGIARAETPADARSLVESAPVVTGFSIDESLLDAADAIELFACTYAGTGHLPRETLADRDIAVTNASGVHGPNIAEHVIGAFLTFTRKFLTARRRQQRHEWRSYQAREFTGSRVAIVGLGAIGRTLADRLAAFDVETVGVRYSPEKGGPTDEVVGFDRIHDALAGSEYVALATPLTEETRGLIDADAFLTMPTDAVLVNVARGPVVDTDDLVAAIRDNHIAGAALDVTDPEPLPPEHPLWDFENVLISAHVAGHTPAYYDRLADIVAPNVERVLAGDDLSDLANRVV
ncbi:D-2-hydroxyacid dehydrogenase [Halococcoides cellulosivorans]|uniref:Hydroxyacid dehydrogenase n=1 Tax=Halococcoides cellulosivorans TaxID=1679096 RepID=A0A2R4X0I4_9EURY|nr:D-2-hydroxyacid dehydrogenase [Halococcoides cellulosivorans]AWB27273.1 hydroxyacid dehydrogenase [Halococcoides cellulosivorans]